MQDTAVTCTTSATELHTADPSDALWLLVRNNEADGGDNLHVGSSSVDNTEGRGIVLKPGERDYFLVPAAGQLYGAASAGNVVAGIYAVPDPRFL